LGAKCNIKLSPYQRYDEGVPGFVDGYALGKLRIWNVFEDRSDEFNRELVERHRRLDVGSLNFRSRKISQQKRLS
jgi:hypothetical protein